MERAHNICKVGWKWWLFSQYEGRKSFLVGDVVYGTVDLGLQNLANSHVFLLVLPRLSLLDVEPFDQLSPLPLPVRLTLLPVGLDLADSGGQLGVLLSLELQLLPEGVQFSIVIAEGSTDQIFLLCELLFDFGEEIVEVGVLLVEVVAILPQFSAFFALLAIDQLQLPLLVLQGPK